MEFHVCFLEVLVGGLIHFGLGHEPIRKKGGVNEGRLDFGLVVNILFHAVVGMKIHVTPASRRRVTLKGPSHLHEE